MFVCIRIYDKASQITRLLGDSHQQICNLIPYVDVSSMVSRYVVSSESYCILFWCGTLILGQIGFRFVEKYSTYHSFIAARITPFGRVIEILTVRDLPILAVENHSTERFSPL